MTGKEPRLECPHLPSRLCTPFRKIPEQFWISDFLVLASGFVAALVTTHPLGGGREPGPCPHRRRVFASVVHERSTLGLVLPWVYLSCFRRKIARAPVSVSRCAAPGDVRCEWVPRAWRSWTVGPPKPESQTSPPHLVVLLVTTRRCLTHSPGNNS